MSELRITIFSTELGWTGVASRGEQLAEVSFGHPSAASTTKAMRLARENPAAPDAFLRDVARRLKAYAKQPEDDFRDIAVDLDGMTDFQKKVIQHCRKIPLGEVLSYGELAEKAGRPQAARAVGQVMASNRYPLIVPCHRVIGANGTLGGYSARDGLTMKLHLLALEGAVCLEGCDCHA